MARRERGLGSVCDSRQEQMKLGQVHIIRSMKHSFIRGSIGCGAAATGVCAERKRERVRLRHTSKIQLIIYVAAAVWGWRSHNNLLCCMYVVNKNLPRRRRAILISGIVEHKRGDEGGWVFGWLARRTRRPRQQQRRMVDGVSSTIF